MDPRCVIIDQMRDSNIIQEMDVTIRLSDGEEAHKDNTRR